jgi:hypothetical protein
MRCGPECKCLECENMEDTGEGQRTPDYFDHHLYFDI